MFIQIVPDVKNVFYKMIYENIYIFFFIKNDQPYHILKIILEIINVSLKYFFHVSKYRIQKYCNTLYYMLSKLGCDVDICSNCRDVVFVLCIIIINIISRSHSSQIMYKNHNNELR